MRPVFYAVLSGVAVCVAATTLAPISALAQDGMATFGSIKGSSAQTRPAQTSPTQTTNSARAAAGVAAVPKGATNFGFGSLGSSLAGAGAATIGGFAGGQISTAIGGSIGTTVGDAVNGAVKDGIKSGVDGAIGANQSGVQSGTGTVGFNSAAMIEDPNAAPDGARDAITGETPECKQNPALCPNNLMTAYDGWEKSNLAYARTPLLFNPRFGQAKRQYPTLTQSGLQSVNLSADDEVVKSTLAIYQPIRFIQQSFAWDKGARDAHLNLFATIRGIAILTLSYLDKTVAAGLATVQQQTDNDTNAQMLKQVGWSVAKMANPNREMLYTDTEEKFDACMFGYGQKQADKMGYVDYKDKFAAIYARINVSCPACETLSPLGEGMDAKEPGSVIGFGRYHYCVCCSETGAIANRGSVIVEDGKDISIPGAYSLVERSFNGKWMLLSKEQMEAGKK